MTPRDVHILDEGLKFEPDLFRSIGKLAGIDKAEVGAYRNTYKHNLSLDILQEGYVSSFIELFELFDKQTKHRQSAG